MAKATSAKTDDALISLSSSKVKRLVIRNFRCIGPQPVTIDLDDIVVLVGPNNVGKSTVLRAYEVVMQHGSNLGRLKIDDFPNEIIDPDNLPEIELQTFIFDEFPASHWLHTDSETGQQFVRERWRWSEPNKDPRRQGRRSRDDDWDDQVPWGAPGVAKSRRPLPHRVDAFASPEEQGDKIIEILKEVLVQRARSSEDQSGTSLIEKISDQIRTLQRELVEKSKSDITSIEESLTKYVNEIFVGYNVSLDARDDEVSEKAFNIFHTKPVLRMGPVGGHMAALERQGSGARRTLLWTALKIAAERASTEAKKEPKRGRTSTETENPDPPRPHVLLLDEPEICLHPSAVRDACRVLYDLAAKESGWQVMVTTHSPIFLDISRDNTTIVRVDRDPTSGDVRGTTVFRPSSVKLTEEDREFLKIINVWDPGVAEFFFGGDCVVVEGDTEYAAFCELKNRYPEKYKNVQIVRARGKFIIPTLAKIMNHFGGRYAILHDIDSPETDAGKKNPAWKANQAILDVVKEAPDRAKVRLAAFLPNFEVAVFGHEVKKDKPYHAFSAMAEGGAAQDTVCEVLDYLIFATDKVPAVLSAWQTVGGLEELYRNPALLTV